VVVFGGWLWGRGHHEPGGGFIAALVAGTGFALFAIAEGPGKVRRAVRVRPATIAFTGLSLAIIAGLPAVFVSRPFLTGIWWNLGPNLSVGTPLIFDIGVFLAVLGAILAILLTLEES